jgi:hypothetical protein
LQRQFSLKRENVFSSLATFGTEPILLSLKITE